MDSCQSNRLPATILTCLAENFMMALQLDIAQPSLIFLIPAMVVER
jgi:hypothetical protein